MSKMSREWNRLLAVKWIRSAVLPLSLVLSLSSCEKVKGWASSFSKEEVEENQEWDASLGVPDLLKAEITMLAYDATFQRTKKGYYELASTSEKLQQKVEFSKLLGESRTIEETEVSTELPDRLKGEYQRCYLKKKGSAYFLETVAAFHTELEQGTGISRLRTVKIKGEVYFVKGSWDEMLKGQPVAFRYNEQGYRNVMLQTRSELQRLISGMAASVKMKDLGSGRRLEISSQIKSFSNEPIEISNGVLTFKQRQPTEMHFIFKIVGTETAG